MRACCARSAPAQSTRLGNDIHFSPAGGVDIEAHWDKLRSVSLDTGAPADSAALAPLLAELPLEARPALEKFIAAAYAVYDDLDASLLEMNPFTFAPGSGQPFPLDMRMELDDTAKFRCECGCGCGAGLRDVPPGPGRAGPCMGPACRPACLTRVPAVNGSASSPRPPLSSSSALALCHPMPPCCAAAPTAGVGCKVQGMRCRRA